MEEAFGVVLFGTVIVAAIVAVITFARTGEAYRQIGRGGLSLNEDEDRPPPAPSRAVTTRERDAEIRQMLEARNARRAARGRETVDVEAELARLTGGAGAAVKADPALREEVRQLVVARNERRVRQGKEPLDVEAEVARQLRDLPT